MPDSAQVRSAVDAAEQAATAGDFTAAARHLHDALALQERELGPMHPDIASTLNNLGVVSERTGDFAEAERCYRRACEIVTAAFPAEHPFVETSRHNLEAFCQARALPVDVPPKFLPEPPRTAAPVVAPPAVAAPPPGVTAAPRPTPPPPSTPPSVEQKPGRLRAVPVVAAVVVVMAFVLWVNRGPRTDTNASAPVPGAVPATKASAPAATSTPTPAPAPPERAATRKPAPPAVAPPATARPPARDGSPAVVEAQLCRALTRGAEWTCARASDPASPGHMYFYTRVTTARDTTIVHRWYRNDRVQLTRELQIEANLGAGYRTYSHLVLDAGSAGQWRVELRTADGRVLREERFVVR